MADQTFKQGQTSPPLGVTLAGASGPIDYTAASAVFMQMEAQAGGTFVASMLMASAIATSGYAKLFWAASQVAMPDSWNCEFVIQWANGGIQYVPNDVVKTILIEPAMKQGTP